jgi:hypothetical protein
MQLISTGCHRARKLLFQRRLRRPADLVRRQAQIAAGNELNTISLHFPGSCVGRHKADVIPAQARMSQLSAGWLAV